VCAFLFPKHLPSLSLAYLHDSIRNRNSECAVSLPLLSPSLFFFSCSFLFRKLLLWQGLRTESWVLDLPLLTSSVIWSQILKQIPGQLWLAAVFLLEMLSTHLHTPAKLFFLFLWKVLRLRVHVDGMLQGEFLSSYKIFF
jgi:hypothetical protein